MRGEIGRDRVPGLAAVGGAMKELRAVIDDVRIVGRDLEGRDALHAIADVAGRLAITILWIDPVGLFLTCLHVHPIELALADSVDDVGSAGLRLHRAGLASRAGHLHHEGIIVVVGEGRQARKDDRPTRVLLRAVQAIRELIIGLDRIDLGRGLVHLARPRKAAVRGDVRAAVVRLNHDVGMVRVDPKRMVVAMGRDAGLERLAAVGGLEEALIVHEDGVGILRVRVNVCVIEGPAQEAELIRLTGPVSTRIVGAIQSALVARGFDQRVHAFRIRGREVEIDLPDEARGQARGELGPRLAAVGRLVDAGAALRFAAADDGPGLALTEPERRVDLVRVRGVHHHRRGPEGVVDIEDLLPRLASVGGAIDASFRVWSPGNALRAHEHHVRVFGMDAHVADLSHLSKPNRSPRLPAVIGPIDTLSEDHVAANAVAARADVDHIRIRLGHFDRADGSGVEKAVSCGLPGDAVVRGLEDPAARRAEVERPGLFSMPGHGGDPTAPRGTHHPVLEAAEQHWIDRRPRGSLGSGDGFGSAHGGEQGEDQGGASRTHVVSFNAP